MQAGQTGRSDRQVRCIRAATCNENIGTLPLAVNNSLAVSKKEIQVRQAGQRLLVSETKDTSAVGISGSLPEFHR
jgi:hypothetical protein